MTSFSRVVLRTIDVDAARAFCSSVLGTSDLEILKLPDQAIARGAPPHWLGVLGVDDPERTASSFVERGARPLGAIPGGLVLRDPGGAVVGLGKPSALSPQIVWCGLNSGDLEAAKQSYGALLGWHFDPPVDLGRLGVIHPFAWARGAIAAGSMTDIHQRPGAHAHWLFHFRVASVEAVVAAVRAAGGQADGPFTLPGGDRIAVCDDPQGAAFAARESPNHP